jgi:hypothetical protein
VGGGVCLFLGVGMRCCVLRIGGCVMSDGSIMGILREFVTELLYGT